MLAPCCYSAAKMEFCYENEGSEKRSTLWNRIFKQFGINEAPLW